ncbi:class I SAM-dependent DNA methyltransferase [Streptomyces meridianus]|uniref:Class I SAM-dependent methyltransferase n=1 Tax=Streptomyces meridianus TaxID=2938945 RepID=A0ABT0X352_9ACTN|nr:class I SAM-dependent methyltransferase [Streptomyces meridianus]MCM2576967.1 class I SAM-dependent methyltransferase [Streptomyces meridianus]
MNADRWLAETRTSYDTVAVDYAALVRDALAEAPYLRAALALFADLVHAVGGGPVADVGCGPGHVTAHLHELGVDAFGIDLSPVMIDVARRDHPHLRFEVGSMTDLGLSDASVAGLLASWSLIHIPDAAVPTVFGHFWRVLRPGAPLLLGFHAGNESRLKTQGYGGHPMNVHVHRRRPAEVAARLRDAGFTVEAHMLLDPDESIPGAVLFARRPATPAGADGDFAKHPRRCPPTPRSGAARAGEASRPRR